MTKKSSAYWQKRFSALENTQNQYGQNTFHQIEPAFDKAERQIQAQIETWYARYASNNGITLAEARKQLSVAELKELQWDVQEYIKYGQENAMNQQWMKELENASARFHISRLEALKLRTQQSLEVAFGNQLDSLDGMVKKLYQSGYYHTCFEVQKGFNIGWEIGQIDERKLQKVISKPWAADGKTFSDRVWQSKTTMVNELHQQMTRTIIQGKAPDEAIKSMTKYLQNKTKNAKYQAGRLVMTEQAFISSAAQKDAFNDLDVEEFEIVATLDSHTSDICKEMDGKHFPMKDFQPGVTAPPFHVWCRSTTVPYFDDEWGRSGERAARGEDGKTYYVPADMTYPEWEKAMVDGQTDDLKPAVPDDKMKVKEPSEAAQYIQKACEANKVEHRPVQKLSKPLSSEEIVNRLAGGDMTEGSCSSLAFAYIGNKNGLDVLDFRGGGSQSVFSLNGNIRKMVELPGVNASITKVKKEISGTMEILNNLVLNKEYYLATGKHAAIVRRLETGVEYLELQSNVQNGWMPFNKYGSMAKTLNKRFGCRKTVDRQFGKVWEKSVVLMDVDSFNGNTDFEQLLGYINTALDSQKKGVTGNVK